MNKRENAKHRTQLLTRLREQHKDTVADAQDRLKMQKKIQREINQAIKDNPKTVPDIAAETNIPSHIVLWNLTALRKYGLVTEAGMSGEYYLYSPAKEVKR
jgi:predicted transcriptional regulator